MANSDFFDVTGHIGQLWVFPIKSCAGIAVQSARLLATGLEHDRAFMLVDGRGEFISQREIARMVLVQPAIADGVMTVTAPGMDPLQVDMAFSGPERAVRVWDDRVTGLQAPDAVNAWFSAFLQTECYLVRMAPQALRLASKKWTGGADAPTQFADGFPVLVVSQASVNELNERLRQAGEVPVVAERFRANIIVEGFQSHDEDRIESLSVQQGGAGSQQWADLPLVKPCARCPIPDIDPATAASGTSVTDTLQTYRHDERLDGAVTFGMNAYVPAGTGGVLRVGDAVGGALQFD
ncbi:MOSC N-terminal beta barrel domain-containing protein [Comamonas sp. MYb21]|uniref:MOSC domain-containing protein n=1 Tax=Comamonas sp. MYb21 TaxID=1848648 RepID=UPI0030A2133A